MEREPINTPSQNDTMLTARHDRAAGKKQPKQTTPRTESKPLPSCIHMSRSGPRRKSPPRWPQNLHISASPQALHVAPSHDLLCCGRHMALHIVPLCLAASRDFWSKAATCSRHEYRYMWVHDTDFTSAVQILRDMLVRSTVLAVAPIMKQSFLRSVPMAKRPLANSTCPQPSSRVTRN